jgi:hypothetical protein
VYSVLITVTVSGNMAWDSCRVITVTSKLDLRNSSRTVPPRFPLAYRVWILLSLLFL